MSDFSEVRALSADLDRSARTVTPRVALAVHKTARDIAATAAQLVPVDQAATRDSIHVTTTPGGAEVGPTTEYAPFLEYGTSRMAPRPFMGPAADEHEPAFLAGVALAGDPDL